MSNLILYIAHTGQGKTTLVKKTIDAGKKKSYVFDVNNEYEKHDRVIDGDFKNFLSECMKKTDHNLIFEDATGYLNGRTADDVRKLIVAKRHKRNNILMLFHSISAVPPFIFQLANYIVLFKTADELNTVKSKKEILVKPFLKLQQQPKYSRIFVKSI